jgi:hypothetical protein
MGIYMKTYYAFMFKVYMKAQSTFASDDIIMVKVVTLGYGLES